MCQEYFQYVLSPLSVVCVETKSLADRGRRDWGPRGGGERMEGRGEGWIRLDGNEWLGVELPC